MTLIRRGGQPPAEDGADSTYMVYGKKVVRKMKVFQMHRDGVHNYYINKEGYKVSSRTLEHGPYVPPQWTPNYRKDRCRDCGGWGHTRCGQNMKQPICNICRELHLDRECPRGVGSREDLERRKREIERLIEQEEERLGKFKTVEREMDAKYSVGKAQNQRKTLNAGPTVGKAYK